MDIKGEIDEQSFMDCGGFRVVLFDDIKDILDRPITKDCPDCGGDETGRGCAAKSDDYHCTTCFPNEVKCNFYKPCPTCKGNKELVACRATDDHDCDVMTCVNHEHDHYTTPLTPAFVIDNFGRQYLWKWKAKEEPWQK